MSNLSREKLIEFLDWTAEKGMFKRGTARSLRTACNAVLSVMDEDEARDVSKVDLDNIIQRYQNLHSLDVSPSTLKSYSQRVKQAVREFLRFNQDQASWKPSGAQRATTPSKSSKTPKSTSRSRSHPRSNGTSSSLNEFDVTEITYPFPLRRDMIVTVKGIPFDVTRSEMARLTAFLSNLVAISEDDHKQLMLPSRASQTDD